MTRTTNPRGVGNPAPETEPAPAAYDAVFPAPGNVFQAGAHRAARRRRILAAQLR
ncbi:MAG: hypothetical protein SW019_18320 [Actinomycetota bacterium]|nr:hypothetical protein [Actinomycetota bacterium]